MASFKLECVYIEHSCLLLLFNILIPGCACSAFCGYRPEIRNAFPGGTDYGTYFPAYWSVDAVDVFSHIQLFLVID